MKAENWRAEILCVGTELLLGDILNTNAKELSGALRGLGIGVYWQSVVGDNPARLRQAVETARARANLIITTGGLGPTYDDLTKEVVCEADEKGGKLAILHGRCIDRRNDTALCAIRLETGRKHQIRAQLSNIGAPLWGDNRYGGGIPGQQIALWGYKLTFRHPTLGEIMTFHSLPEGNIWDTYADLLTVPEDTDTPREKPALVLREDVVQKLEEFDKYKPIKVDELL